MANLTTNYGWTKPVVGGDTDAWGGELNSDLDGIDSTVFAVSGVANAAQAAAMNDNRIINGDMRIDQRNNGASGVSTKVYTIDRWYYDATQAGKGTWGRNFNSVIGPTGFPYYLGFQSSSAYTLLASDYFTLHQSVEADMVSDFAWGTANAQSVTLSFWAQSSLTGTFSGAINNYAWTRNYPFSFSLPTANTWTKIVVTIPGDTTGTWTMSGNSGAFNLYFDLGTGSTYRGPANVWAGGSGYLGVTGAVSVVTISSATFYVTGVKVEIGNVATPFNRYSLAKSMSDCQRYYQGPMAVQLQTYGLTAFGITLPFQVAMRAAPTIVKNFTTSTNCSAQTLTANDSFSYQHAGTVTAAGLFNSAGSFTASAEL